MQFTKISLFGGGGKKTGFHFTVFVSVSISDCENDKLFLGKASAVSCVLLSNISGGELGCLSVYITCKISCKTPRGRGFHPKCLMCWVIHSIPFIPGPFPFIFFQGHAEHCWKMESGGGGAADPQVPTRLQVTSSVREGAR